MKKRGKGIACSFFGVGNTGKTNPSSAFVQVCEDGTAIVLCGAADVGQGSDTALAQIAAEELGIRAEDVTVKTADTLITQDAGLSAGSRHTYISGNAVKIAAAEAKRSIMKEAAAVLESSLEDIIAADGLITARKTGRQAAFKEMVRRIQAGGKLALGAGYFNPENVPLDENGQGVPYPTYHFCTQAAEVEVDTETGEVVVLSLVAAHDVGRAINPQAVEGQIEGGVVMGLGYALMEEIVMQKGMLLTPSFSEYMVPTSLDFDCSITPVIIEDTDPTGPFGAKGTGEPPVCPTAAAVANAIYNAVGVRIKDFPITAEKVFWALHRKGESLESSSKKK